MLRILYYFQTLDKRFKRFASHLSYPIYKSKYRFYNPSSHLLEWFYDLPFYVIDLLAIPEIYEFVFNLFKWNVRSIDNKELELAQSIYKNNINFKFVKIDSMARFGTRKLALAYVSFNTINYYKKMSSQILIHELMHIWQYQNFGSVYISRAIKAQNSTEAYDYGGIQNLYRSMLKKAKLLDFNFEQQADIVEDYHQLSINEKTSPMNLNIYLYFIEQLSISNQE